MWLWQLPYWDLGRCVGMQWRARGAAVKSCMRWGVVPARRTQFSSPAHRKHPRTPRERHVPTLERALTPCCVAVRHLPSAAQVPMFVNKITSTKTQLPFRYYSLPFCRPDAVAEEDLNLGEILSGDSIENSDYELYTGYNEFCKILCRKVYTDGEAAQFASKIHVRAERVWRLRVCACPWCHDCGTAAAVRCSVCAGVRSHAAGVSTCRRSPQDEYTVHWILDNLPAAVRLYDEANPSDVVFQRGFPLGFVDSLGEAYLYNHVRFIIKTNDDDEVGGMVRVVGFEVEPFRYATPRACAMPHALRLVVRAPWLTRSHDVVVFPWQREAHVPGHVQRRALPAVHLQRRAERGPQHAAPAHPPRRRGDLHIRRQVGGLGCEVGGPLGSVRRFVRVARSGSWCGCAAVAHGRAPRQPHPRPEPGTLPTRPATRASTGSPSPTRCWWCSCSPA